MIGRTGRGRGLGRGRSLIGLSPPLVKRRPVGGNFKATRHSFLFFSQILHPFHPSFVAFYWVLPSFTGLYQCLAWFHPVLLGFTVLSELNQRFT